MKKGMKGSGSERGFGMLATIIPVVVTVAALVTINHVKPGAGVEQDRVALTQKRMESVQNALKAYNSANTKLPCPASNTAAFGASGFGTAVANCASSVSCTAGVTCTTNSSTTSVAIGSVPVRTLNLSDDLMFDGWGRRFIYAVDAEYITSTASGTNNVAIYKDGSDVTASSGQKYALISAGRDGKGAYGRSGQKTVKCRKVSTSEDNGTLSGDYSSTSSGARLAIDEDNCNSVLTSGSKRFYYNGWDTNPTSSTNYYDDIALLHAPFPVSSSGASSGSTSGSSSSSSSSSGALPSCPAGVLGCSWWFNASDMNGDGDTAVGEPVNGAGVCTSFNGMKPWYMRGPNTGFWYLPAGSCFTNAPTYRSSVAALNNKPAVEFDGVNDYLIAGGAWGPALSPREDYTLFIVLVKKGDGIIGAAGCDTQYFGDMALLHNNVSNVAAGGYRNWGVAIRMDNRDNGSKLYVYGNDVRSRNEDSNPNDCTTLGNKGSLFYITNNYINSTSVEITVKRYGSDRPENIYSQPNQVPSGGTGGITLYLGYFTAPPAAQQFEGYIAEMIAYRGTVLSATDISTINAYLAAKYNLP